MGKDGTADRGHEKDTTRWSATHRPAANVYALIRNRASNSLVEVGAASVLEYVARSLIGCAAPQRFFPLWTFHRIMAHDGSPDGYYDRAHLPKFGDIAEGNQALADKFFDYYGAVFADGALSAREKALIALAVAHTVQCPYCIDAYTTDSLEKGADLEQMTEAVHVATAIRGGASLVHGVQMLEQTKKMMM